MSEMNEANLKSSHVIYVGYLSALDKLEDFVFASSALAIGYTYDELRNMDTGELYTSEAGMPGANRNYRDFAFISMFPGPGGNQIMIVAGTRDAGLMQAAHALSDPMFVASMERARPDTSQAQPPSFEMLYEVTGYGRTNLDAMLVHPILINRPFVVTELGTRLCRPSELVLDLLPPQRGAFSKEDGEAVVDAGGQRVK